MDGGGDGHKDEGDVGGYDDELGRHLQSVQSNSPQSTSTTWRCADAMHAHCRPFCRCMHQGSSLRRHGRHDFVYGLPPLQLGDGL